MNQTITFGQFADAFRDHGRENQFSYAGLRALFDYMEHWEDETGQPYELDVIELCCDWCEYASALEATVDHGEAFDDEAEALQWLEHNTIAIGFSGGVIIANF